MKREIIRVKYADSDWNENHLFLGGDPEKRRPIRFYVYVIRTEDRVILVDAGCETMPGFEMKGFVPSVEALRREGIDPHSVTDVILTHAHHDHIECVRYFPQATVHIEQAELERAMRYIPADFSVHAFTDAYTLCEGVEIQKIGGHSPGSCIVRVAGEGTTYILAGDECYQRENLTKCIPTGCSVCPEKSLEFVRTYRDGRYTVLLMHDD